MSAIAVRGTSSKLAACRGVWVVYGSGEVRVEALADASIELEPGETTALLGPSGSGKTTLLHVLGGLVLPSSGTVTWRGEPLSSLDAAARRTRRARGIAYVFQGSNLLPHLSAWENVAFAAAVSRAHRADDYHLAPDDALALVGLRERGDTLPAELSGGERQRIAIARAISQEPELLLCDEPTGQLDSDTGARVLDMLEALQREFGFALVIATHDAEVATRARRAVELADGRIVSEVSP